MPPRTAFLRVHWFASTGSATLVAPPSQEMVHTNTMEGKGMETRGKGRLYRRDRANNRVVQRLSTDEEEPDEGPYMKWIAYDLLIRLQFPDRRPRHPAR